MKIVCIKYVFNASYNVLIPVNTTLLLVVYMIGKACIATVMSAIYVYTSELYPTKYRNSLFAFSSMMGRIGSILAPLTPALVSCGHHSRETRKRYSLIIIINCVFAGFRGMGAATIRTVWWFCTAFGITCAAHSGDARHAAT